MDISSVKLANFRIFKSLQAHFVSGLNLLIGDNGQGKTSLLEAIYLLATARSFRTQEIRDAVRHEDEFAFVEGVSLVVPENHAGKKYEQVIRVTIYDDTKQCFVDGEKLPISEFYGRFGAVILSNRDLSIVRGSPEERRRFIDRAISASSPIYFSVLMHYRRALRQRNAMLRKSKETLKPINKVKKEIETWDTQLVEWGRKLIVSRERYIDRIAAVVREKYNRLFDGSLKLILSYVSSLKKKMENPLNSRQHLLMPWRRISIGDIVP